MPTPSLLDYGAISEVEERLGSRHGGPLVGQVYCPWLWPNWRTGYDTLLALKTRTVVVTDSVEHADKFPWPERHMRDVHGSDLSDIDVFHVHNGWTLATRGCELMRRFKDKKFVCTLIGTDINVHSQGPRAIRRYREFFDGASAVVCISEFLAEVAVKRGCDPDKIVVIPLAVDPRALPGVKHHGASERGKLKCGMVARFVRVKNIGDAIQAVSLANQHAVDTRVELHVCGNGSMRGALELMADYVNEQLGWKAVTIHDDGRGMFDHERAMEILLSCDCVVSCSKRQEDGAEEGLGVSIIEGQMMGLPALAYWTGGVGEIVEQNVTGWLARPADKMDMKSISMYGEEATPEGLARCMVRLAWNLDARQAMGINARELAMARFSTESVALRLDDLYRDVARS